MGIFVSLKNKNIKISLHYNYLNILGSPLNFACLSIYRGDESTKFIPFSYYSYIAFSNVSLGFFINLGTKLIFDSLFNTFHNSLCHQWQIPHSSFPSPCLGKFQKIYKNSPILIFLNLTNILGQLRCFPMCKNKKCLFIHYLNINISLYYYFFHLFYLLQGIVLIFFFKKSEGMQVRKALLLLLLLFYFFLYVHTRKLRKEIRTSDIHFIRRDLQLIELL